MGTQNSSQETRDRSKRLASDIGSYHVDFNFDTVVLAITNLFTVVTNFQPKFKVHGGSTTENAALQNVQARLRMVLSYLFASMLPTVRQRPGGGGLLVLASSNVDGKSYPFSYFILVLTNCQNGMQSPSHIEQPLNTQAVTNSLLMNPVCADTSRNMMRVPQM